MCNFPQFGPPSLSLSLSLARSLTSALPFSLPFHLLPLPLAVPSCPLLCLPIAPSLSPIRVSHPLLRRLSFSADPPRLRSPLLTYLNETRSRHYECRDPSRIRQRCAVTRAVVTRHSRDSKTEKGATTLADSSVIALIDRPLSRPTAPTLHSERERERCADRNSFNLSDTRAASSLVYPDPK